MNLREFYDRIGESRLAKGFKYFYQTAIFLSGAIILLAMVATVLLRYVFKVNLFGMDEIILCFVFWFYFFGGVNGSMEDSQIRADVASTFIKNPKITWILRLVTRCIEISVLLFLFVLSVQLFITNCQRMPTTQGLKIPYIVPQFAIVFGFFTMCMYNIGYFLKELGTPPQTKESEQS